MGYKIKQTTLIGVYIYIFCCIFFVINPYTEMLNKTIAIGVLLLSGIFIYRCRDNILFSIMSLFIGYVNYSIAIGIYIYPNLRPKYLYPQITDVKVYGTGIAMIFLFMLVLLCFQSRSFTKSDISFPSVFIQKKNLNSPIFLCSLVIFIVIMTFGYSWKATGLRGGSSPLYEYNVILLILMFYYSGDRKVQKTICCLCAVIYILISFVNGNRVEGVNCLLIVAICMIKKQLPTWMYIAGIVGGIIFMNFIGIFRGNYLSLALGIQSSLTDLLESKFVFDTCMHAYFPALCMIEQFMTYSMADAWYFLSRFLLTIIVGQSRVIDGDLIEYVRSSYYHNYGGVTMGFFYVWFSYLGAFLYGYIVGLYMRFVNLYRQRKYNSPIKLCAILYIVATVPRWYLYGPWAFSRGVLLCILIFAVVQNVDKRLFHKKQQYKRKQFLQETQNEVGN